MNTEGNIQPHSKVKLTILQRYIPTLIDIISFRSKWTKIKVLDVFCGKGFSSNGEEGSAIRLFDCLLGKASVHQKNFELILNDIDQNNTSSVRNHIEEKFKGSTVKNLTVSYVNSDAQTLLEQEIKNSKDPLEFKFLFYDPFNYKSTKKSLFSSFLETGRSEVLIFIPFSNIYRFLKAVREKTWNDEHGLVSYLKENLGEKHEIFQREVTENEFLKALEDAYSVNNFRSTSLFIQEKQNRYALIFLTKSPKGQEVFLEACYKDLKEDEFKANRIYSISDNVLTLKVVDGDQGQRDLFGQSQVSQLDDDLGLTEKLFQEMKGKTVTNSDLYEFILSKKILPKHVKNLLYSMKENNKLIIKDSAGVVDSKKKPGLYLAFNPDKKVMYEFYGN